MMKQKLNEMVNILPQRRFAKNMVMADVKVYECDEFDTLGNSAEEENMAFKYFLLSHSYSNVDFEVNHECNIETGISVLDSITLFGNTRYAYDPVNGNVIIPVYCTHNQKFYMLVVNVTDIPSFPANKFVRPRRLRR